jgi:hypothetical protein
MDGQAHLGGSSSRRAEADSSQSRLRRERMLRSSVLGPSKVFVTGGAFSVFTKLGEAASPELGRELRLRQCGMHGKAHTQVAVAP